MVVRGNVTSILAVVKGAYMVADAPELVDISPNLREISVKVSDKYEETKFNFVKVSYRYKDENGKVLQEGIREEVEMSGTLEQFVRNTIISSRVHFSDASRVLRIKL